MTLPHRTTRKTGEPLCTIIESRQGCSERSMPRRKTNAMTRSRIAVLAMAAALSAVAPMAVSAQPQPPGPPLSADERRCAGLNAAAPDAQAASCTTLLGSGRYVGDNLAIVHANLGIAYARSGDYDRAI